MYIQEVVINKYKKLINQNKARNLTDEEVMYKIRKSIDLGKQVYNCNDGAKLVQYYDLIFKIENFRCVKVYRDVKNPSYIVSKEDKKRYDNEFLEENGYTLKTA